MVDYYDIILGTIPVALLGIPTTLYATGVNHITAITTGGVIAASIMAHALFINTPTTTRSKTTEHNTRTETVSVSD